MSNCQHSYVVRNIVGANRFLCKECDERFPHHPGLTKVEDQGTFTLDGETIERFRDGLITMGEAAKETTIAAEDFLEAIRTILPPTANVLLDTSLGGVKVGTVVSVEPQRTSCPKAIDDFFSNPDITTTDIQDMFDDKIFPDIVDVTHDHSVDYYNPCDPYRTSVTITFVDDTQQLVYLHPKGHFYS